MNENKYSIKKPFLATIKEVKAINKEGSSKLNNHAVISLEGSNITYEVGCSFGLLPQNPEEEVETILSILGAQKEQIVRPRKLDREISIYDFFLEHVNLHRFTKKLANALLPLQKNDKLETILENSWKEHGEIHDLSEFLSDFYHTDLGVDALVDLVCPMLARFYSVASSNKHVGDNIHLLLADFSYKKGKKTYRSITTRHLHSQQKIRLFHQKNPSFQPPKEDSPIIMVGPGTGIAAFRGFLQERIDVNKCKNNILFTGDRNKAFDFYYQDELKKYEADGNLTLFTAFSRDHAHKVYVQDRMWEQKELLFDILENKNGHLYISGDASRMAKDVIATLEKIFGTLKNLSPEDAHRHVKSLIKAKQMHLDVY